MLFGKIPPCVHAQIQQIQQIQIYSPLDDQIIKVYLFMLALLFTYYRRKWYMKWIVYWTWDMKSSEAMILTIMNERHFNKNSGLQRGLHLWPRFAGATL